MQKELSKAASIAKDKMTDAVKGQLAALWNGLKDYAETVSEDQWNKLYAANVRKQLREAVTDTGARRYMNAASQEVTLNMLKRATMGLTLARHDATYSSLHTNSTNIKKYAKIVGDKLQRENDPATGEPRLRSNPKKPKEYRRLYDGKMYYLIGCETTEGLGGANTVVSASRELSDLQDISRRLGTRYKKYIYTISEDLKIEEQPPVEPDIVNAAVFANSIPFFENEKDEEGLEVELPVNNIEGA